MKLERIVNGIGDLQSRLANADRVQSSNTDEQFSKLLENVQKELKRLVDTHQNSAHEAITSVVQKAIYPTTQTQVTLLNSLLKIANDADSASKLISGEIGKASSRKDVAELSKQVLALGLQIDELPKTFPLPKDIDLSGLSKGITELKTSISSIKFPEMPKTIDVTPQLKAMEKRMGKRVVEFEVIRDSFGLIQKIVVTEGAI